MERELTRMKSGPGDSSCREHTTYLGCRLVESELLVDIFVYPQKHGEAGQEVNRVKRGAYRIRHVHVFEFVIGESAIIPAHTQPMCCVTTVPASVGHGCTLVGKALSGARNRSSR
jgi:hypothetical protein